MSSSPSSRKAICRSAESPLHRSYFYVGGQYVDDDKGDGQHILTGQMYVEQLLPVDGVKHPWPLVFIQGAGQTGTVSLHLSYIIIALKIIVGLVERKSEGMTMKGAIGSMGHVPVQRTTLLFERSS